ncbi:MAG TPA: nucleotidyl transferase AbiEii/AbiGii toxin family protein [Ignavibacteriaceae bacterium]|nr:nucleotidyl transferase AbiEii/AbiGii toxin family protein [Ignavibacteriaceae bacterium]
MLNKIYLKQAEFLLRILPHINYEEAFALKGGTALNFFWRDFPRLSVDIDLCYTKIQDRESSLIEINDAFTKIEERLKRAFGGIKIQQKKIEGKIIGLILDWNNALVKIEANTIIRGTIFPVVNKKLCPKAENTFELTTSVNTVSFEDLYGGKICAALDRQHPRDLFDLKLLLENEGITPSIIKAFLFYLISHDRPMIEILNPGLQDISQTFINEFNGMTSNEIKLDELVDVRKNLIQIVKASLTEEHKKFILSFKNRTPEWELSGIEGIENYPSVRWKLINLERMSKEKHTEAYKKLKDYLL